MPLIPIDVGVSMANAPASGSNATVENNANIVFSSPGANFTPQSLSGSTTASSDATAAASGAGSAVAPGASAGAGAATSSSLGIILLLGGGAAAIGLIIWMVHKHKKK